MRRWLYHIHANKGFTLVELLAAVSILAALAVVSVFSLTAWHNHSRFTNSESGAKTLFLTAESALSYYRSEGKLAGFLEHAQTAGEAVTVTAGGREHTVYALRGDDEALTALLSPFLFDQTALSHALCLEFSPESGQVFSAFYSTEAASLTYGPGSGGRGGAVSMADRAYEARKKLGLGYYSAVDLANVRVPKLTKLKMTALRLNNDETLNLAWASNAPEVEAVVYDVALYREGDNAPLLTLSDLAWGASGGPEARWVDCALAGGSSVKALLSCGQDRSFTLTLDAMVTASLGAADTAGYLLSLTDLVAEGVQADSKVFATVRARPAGAYQDTYIASGTVESNKANPFYGDATKEGAVSLEKFRHISNIRYYEALGAAGEAAFRLDARGLVWGSAPIFAQTAQARLDTATVFPTVPEFKEGWVLEGNGYAIASLALGRGADGQCSILPEAAENLGLFGTNGGTIRRLTLTDPVLRDTERAYAAAGMAAGRSGGVLEEVAIVGAADIQAQIAPGAGGGPVGLGGLVGVQTGGRLAGCAMAGRLTGEITAMPEGAGGTEGAAAWYYPGGIGGLVGHGAGVAIEKAKNEAAVTGNAMAGGVAGVLIRGDGDSAASLTACQNQGLVLCFAEAQGAGYEGRCAGGIVGYAQKVTFTKCVSKPMPAAGAELDAAALLERMKGAYVGGIAGYCDEGMLDACETQGGYVLGGSHVGGVAGGAQGDLFNAPGASVTAKNGAYVLGRSYVGGILGANGAGSTVTRCVNNGVALAYTAYAGGIAGHNTGIIQNCESQIYDYGNQKFTLLSGWVEAWKAAEGSAYRGDYTGGIVGYNGAEAASAASAGQVLYTGSRGDALATIVLGGDFSGGVIGFNDEGAVLALGGRAVGSRVSGQDFTGGLIGLNRSEKLYAQGAGDGLRLSITPYAVTGTNFVGGVIGANILRLEQDVTLSLAAGNPMAQVRGYQYVGGVVGYNQALSGNGSARDFERLTAALKASARGAARYGFDLAAHYSGPYGASGYTCTLTGGGSGSAANNLAVYATAFGGGILGYNEPNSRLVLSGCRNTGNVTQNSPVGNGDKISLSAYTGGEFSGLYGSFLGGILGLNPQYGHVTGCVNTGVVSADAVTGGVVGVNQGRVTDCRVQVSLGSGANGFVGGVAGINDQTGEITGCTFAEGYLINAQSYAGGVAALNRGVIGPCGMEAASLRVSGECVGALAGYNMAGGRVSVEQGLPNLQYVSGGAYVGGLVGKNAGALALRLSGPALSRGNARVDGASYVGGLIGGFTGGGLTGVDIVNAATVTASNGLAGGVIGGVADGARLALSGAVNEGLVTASQGLAGGIVGSLGESGTLTDCVNYASVSNPFQGADTEGQRAGGIAAVNRGTLQGCRVEAREDLAVTGRAYLGGVAGENYGDILGCSLSAAAGKTLSIRDAAGQGSLGLGGVAGYNKGRIVGVSIGGGVALSQEGGASAPRIEALGGVAGVNLGTVSGAQGADGVALALSFYNVRYAGGVVGDNQGVVSGFSFTGSLLDQGGSGGGYCLGGVVGRNGSPDTLAPALVRDCSVTLATAGGRAAISTTGVFNATITDNHALAARSATLAGGVAGANYRGASIQDVLVNAPDTAQMLSAASAMLGGVAGYNNGVITRAGDPALTAVFSDGADGLDALDEKAGAAFAAYGGIGASARTIALAVNGHAGGIAGVNGAEGSLSACLSGRWYIQNGSTGPDSCAGGVIGMNVTAESLERLISFARVSRERQYVAGGIVGRQECGSSGWRMALCGNYGAVSAQEKGGRFTGGVIGNLKYGCGTLDQCWNRGNLGGTSGGIVGRVYRYATGDTLNLIGCKNYGTATGGILHKVQDGYGNNRKLTINLVDCVNYGQVNSGGAGMMAACTDGALTTTMLRCRNYGGGGYGMRDTIKGAQVCTGCFDITQRSRDSMQAGTNAKSSRNYTLYSADVKLTGLAASSVLPAPDTTGRQERPNPSPLFIAQGADGNYYAAGLLYETSLGALQASPGDYALSKDNLYILETATKAPVAEVVLQLGRELPTLTTGAAAPAAARLDAAAVEPYYERLYDVEHSLAAPTGLTVAALGQENQAAWENANDFVYYYELEAYCFETEAQAQAALAGSLQGGAATIEGLAGYVGSITGLKAYEAKAVFNAPAAWENKAYLLRVRACSTVAAQNSAWAGAAGPFASFITPPTVRGELTAAGGGYYYRFYLEPSQADALAAEYGAKAGAGQAWRVKISAGTSAPVYLSADRPIVRLNATNNATLSLKAQAQIVAADALLKEDAAAGVVSQSVASEAQTLLAKYGDGNLLKLTGLAVSLKGTAANGLTLEANLRRAAGDFVPTYRVELVRAAGGEETVVALADVAMSQTSHALTLSGLPEDLFTGLQGEDRVYVRAWLAQTALGPAYAYHQLAEDAAGNPVTAETEHAGAGTAAYARNYPPTSKVHTADMAEGEFDYYYASALSQAGYSRTFELAAPALLPPPVLAGEAALSIDPATDQASYTFAWDKAADIAGAGGPAADYTGATYQAAVLGLLADGTEISLYEGSGNGGAPNTDGGVTLTLDGDAIKGWEAYDQVRLTVTRMGSVDADGNTATLGQAAAKAYRLDKRLPQVEAPAVASPDLNSLKHTVSWKPVAGESACTGYRVTVAALSAPGGGAPAPLEARLAPADFGAGPLRSLTVDLEAFAGLRVSISVAALGNNGAGAPKVYDSPAGVALEYDVPVRLENLLASLAPAWGDGTAPMPGGSFLNGGVAFTANASEALAGTYVAVGLVGDGALLTGLTEADAQDWAAWAQAQGGAVTALGQIQLSAAGASYSGAFTGAQGLLRAHGGQSLCILTQATAHSAVSSRWQVMGVYPLPKVQLDAPVLSGGTALSTVMGQEYASDLTTPTGSPFVANVGFQTVSFAPVADAAAYALSLTGSATYLTNVDAGGNASTAAAPFHAEFAVTQAGGGYTVSVTQGYSAVTATAGNVPQTPPAGAEIAPRQDLDGQTYYPLATGYFLQELQLPTGGGTGQPRLVYYPAELRLYVNADGSLRLALPDPAGLGSWPGYFATTSLQVTARPAPGDGAFTDSAPAAWPGGAP